MRIRHAEVRSMVAGGMEDEMADDDPYAYESVPFKERKRITFKCCDP